MLRLPLHWQILVAILAGAVTGWWSGESTALAGVRLYDVYDFFGTLFLNALKMIIVPLVMSSIITGVGSLAGDNLGRLGAKTILFFLASSTIAILIGLTLVNLLQPGIKDGLPLIASIDLVGDTDTVEQAVARVEGRGVADTVGIFLRMIPENVVAAAAQGEMLGLIVFSVLFGIFMRALSQARRDVLAGFWQAVFEVMMAMTEFIMKFAPIGVFALVAQTVAATGLALIEPVMLFFLTVVLGLALHAFGALALVLRFLARVSPRLHFRAVSPALLTAFSSASSSATLPLTLDCLERRAGVSNRTSSFVLPLGATINMDGTALYECVAAMFIAQAYGIEMHFAQQFFIVVIALLTSIGVAGVPAASLVAISIILGAVGVPLEGIGLLMVTDRLLDMMRTSVNVFSDTCCAVFVARSEGEQTRLEPPAT